MGDAPGSAAPDEAAVSSPEDAIPDDVATSHEELPADFWDLPPAEPQRPARRDAPARAPAAPSPDAATDPAPRGRGARSGQPRSGQRASDPTAAEPALALERALLGAEAADAAPDDDGERSNDALVDTLQALQELFPGEVLAVTPRESPSEADEPTLQGEANGAEPHDDAAATPGADAPERDPGTSGT